MWSTLKGKNLLREEQIPFFFFEEFTVKILKCGTPQTIAIIVLKIEKFDVTLYHRDKFGFTLLH